MSLPEAPAPLSIKLKLNHSSDSSSTNPPSNSAQPPLSSAFSSTPLSISHNLSPGPEVGGTPGSSTAQSPGPGSVSSPAQFDSNGLPVKKRRRTQKKGPNDIVQPGGKGWRKGVKGVIVAGQPLPPRDPNITIVTNNGPAPHSHTSSHPTSFRGFPAAPSLAPAKTPAGYLAPQPLERRTPRPREWTLGPVEFASVTGKPLRLRSWRGGSDSPYRRAVHPTPPPQAPTQPPSQTDSLAPTPPGLPQPHPLSNHTFAPTAPSTSAATSPDPSRLPTSHEPSPAPAAVTVPVYVDADTIDSTAASVPVAMDGVGSA